MKTSKILLWTCVGLSFLGTVRAATRATHRPPLTDEEVRSVASSLVEVLRSRLVRLPDGSRVPAVGDAPEALLRPDQVHTAVETIGEAEGWPEAWIVVQLSPRSIDVVLPVKLGEGGVVDVPGPVFTRESAAWSVERLRAEVRSETGKKARRGVNLVLLGITRRVNERFFYDPVAAEKGLMALVEGGGLLREARRVDLGDGRIHTLAVVLQQAEFLPSECEDCASRVFGHADTGKVLLVLAGDEELEATLDVTALLSGFDGRPLLPRYACERRDRLETQRSVRDRFRDRKAVELLALEDLDGDGTALELSLPAAHIDCGQTRMLRVRIASEAALEILDR